MVTLRAFVVNGCCSILPSRADRYWNFPLFPKLHNIDTNIPSYTLSSACVKTICLSACLDLGDPTQPENVDKHTEGLDKVMNNPKSIWITAEDARGSTASFRDRSQAFTKCKEANQGILIMIFKLSIYFCVDTCNGLYINKLKCN